MDRTSNDFRFSAAVASFGMLLRKSAYSGNSSYQSILDLANPARGTDKYRYRAEFIQLVEKAAVMDHPIISKENP